MLFTLILTPLVLAQSWQDKINQDLQSVSCAPISSWPATFVENAEYTILCPPTPINDADVLRYHIIPGTFDPAQLAEPRQQSIAFSLLNQALVLEKSPTTAEFLVRGADWNVSSLATNKTSGSVFIQPMKKVRPSSAN